jgi:hypothetical protein
VNRHRVDILRSIVLCGIACALLQGCALFHRHGVPAIVGTWKNTAGAVWTIRGDGTFDVDVTADGKPDIRGRYSVAEDQITLRATGGLPRSCRQKAVYQFQRRENTLRFTLVEDRCNMRKKHMLLPWRLITP